MFFLSYPRTCAIIFDVFRCHPLRDGSRYLTVDFQYSCDDGWKGGVWPVAATAGLVYAVGVPALFFWRLWAYREALFDPDGPRDAVGRPVSPAAGPDYHLGFLYRNYDPDKWWFECIELVRVPDPCHASSQTQRPRRSPRSFLGVGLTPHRMRCVHSPRRALWSLHTRAKRSQVRKLLLCAALTLLAPGTITQAVVAMIFSILYMVCLV